MTNTNSISINEEVAPLVDWLKIRKPELGDIPIDADLVAEGILDSLQFVNFLFVIEQLREEPIPQDLVIPSNFVSLESIASNFLGSCEIKS